MTNAESFLPTLSAVAAVYLIAVASPGPNFFLLSQLSLSNRRAPGVWVALGITLGSTIWAVLSMAGVASLLASFGWIYTTIRLLGATYLIWFGGQLLWSSINGTPAGQLRFAALPSARKAFQTGVITSLTNPKSGAFWTSVFASIFPVNAPSWLFLATVLMIAAISSLWHIGIVFLFASRRVQIGYQKLRRPIDAICGTLLVVLGGRLAATR
jgi:threonine/homoserine/homoserine lactone efflux protein